MKTKTPPASSLEVLRRHFQKHSQISDSDLQIEIESGETESNEVDYALKRVYAHYNAQLTYPPASKKAILQSLAELDDSCQELTCIGAILVEQCQIK